MLRRRILLCLLCVGPLAASGQVVKNGFILTEPSVPLDAIVEGGPPRDGIPSIDSPRFVAADQANFLDDTDRVLAVTIDGEARAYPIKILNWHEIVNDKLGEQYLVVTYCPLCGSGIVFATNAADDRLVFGTSGLLYNSDLLLYDRNTESLWSQLMGEAISGKLKGVKLPQLVATHTTWGDWRSRHEQTLVLSTDTGFTRNYEQSPYAGYEDRPDLYFELTRSVPETYHPKQAVLGVKLKGRAKAYPFIELERRGDAVFTDTLGIYQVRVHWDEAARSARITDAAGTELPSTLLYWFAWFVFNPDTEVYQFEE